MELGLKGQDSHRRTTHYLSYLLIALYGIGFASTRSLGVSYVQSNMRVAAAHACNLTPCVTRDAFNLQLCQPLIRLTPTVDASFSRPVCLPR